MKKGKEYDLWQKIRASWIERHPPDYEGGYQCWLCRKWITPEDLTLDHVIPKSNFRNRANRHEDSNLLPAHWACNNSKGSKIVKPQEQSERKPDLIDEIWQ